MRKYLLVIVAAVLVAFLLSGSSVAKAQATDTYTYDFTSSDGTFSVLSTIGGYSPATYTSGIGWQWISNSASTIRVLFVTPRLVCHIEFVGTAVDGSTSKYTMYNLDSGLNEHLQADINSASAGIIVAYDNGVGGCEGPVYGIDLYAAGLSGVTTTVSSLTVNSIGSLGYPTPTPSPTITPSPTETTIPCGGFLCVTVAPFAPVCTITPQPDFTPSETATSQFVNSTIVFPTVAPFPTVPTSTPNTTHTPTPGPSPTLFQTQTLTASPGPSSTATATIMCNAPTPIGTPVATFGEHDYPGGACYRIFPAVGFVIDALVVLGYQVTPQLTVIAHPVDFCFTLFKLDVTLAGIDLWSWLLIAFNIRLAAWVVSVFQNQ